MRDAAPPAGDDTAARQAMMRVLAAAPEDELTEALARLSPLPVHEILRAPEVGLVMLRGRIQGDGAPFNIGEATVTRAAVRVATGETGFSYLLGRCPARAKAAAIVDALWQAPATRAAVEQEVLAPLRARQAERRRLAAARTAATRVDFFTMVRGEDAP